MRYMATPRELSKRLINTYLEKLVIPKPIICPVLPNVSIVPRPLFPWTNSFPPSESIS
jgi:hypothetical protein